MKKKDQNFENLVNTLLEREDMRKLVRSVRTEMLEKVKAWRLNSAMVQFETSVAIANLIIKQKRGLL